MRREECEAYLAMQREIEAMHAGTRELPREVVHAEVRVEGAQKRRRRNGRGYRKALLAYSVPSAPLSGPFVAGGSSGRSRLGSGREKEGRTRPRLMQLL